MFRGQRRSGSKSQTGFMLINGTTKQQSPVKWQWLTQRNMYKPQIQQDKTTTYLRHTYSQKKSILPNLQQKQHRLSSFRIKDGFSLNQITKKRATTSSQTIKISNKRGNTAQKTINRPQQKQKQSLKDINKKDIRKSIQEKNKLLSSNLPQDTDINQLLQWYGQKYSQQKTNQQPSKQNQKNLLFQSKSHYPKQINNKRLLQMARQKLQGMPITNNRHKFIPRKMDLMMQHIKRQQQTIKNNIKPTTKKTNFQPFLSKKDMLYYLDKKNNLLTTQNIPYLIQKYGMNRFQIFNLYNLYKSLEKVSLMRKPSREHMQNVMAKGIDRQTFEVGLKGLDMVPGDQLIKNICHFGDFICWQHFIKIISISLRKTPEQKLTAILKGISSSDNQGFLTRHQISLMIGNSLHKLFDRQETDLKDYFTNMAMKQFDSQNTGKINIGFLKQKILGKGSQNLTMVSFLILNT